MNLEQLKFILCLENHHSIFINTKNIKFIVEFLNTNEKILKNSSISLMFPQEFDIEADKNTLIYKFSPMLKTFLENNNKTIITFQSTLNLLIKNEKMLNFYKFLLKKNKNIVVFNDTGDNLCATSIEKPYYYIIIEESEFIERLNIFDTISDIKNKNEQSFLFFTN